MSTHNIRFYREIRKNVDSPSYLGLYKPSSIMPTTCLHSSHRGSAIFAVVSFMYAILLSYTKALVCIESFYMNYLIITEDYHDLCDFCDLTNETHFEHS